MTAIEAAEEYRRFVLANVWPAGTVRRLSRWERLLRYVLALARI